MSLFSCYSRSFVFWSVITISVCCTTRTTIRNILGTVRAVHSVHAMNVEYQPKKFGKKKEENSGSFSSYSISTARQTCHLYKRCEQYYYHHCCLALLILLFGCWPRWYYICVQWFFLSFLFCYYVDIWMVVMHWNDRIVLFGLPKNVVCFARSYYCI